MRKQIKNAEYEDEPPSFAISPCKEYRNEGFRSRLMVKMLELLKWQG